MFIVRHSRDTRPVVAVHSGGDAAGREIEMKPSGGVAGADDGSNRDASSLTRAAVCRPHIAGPIRLHCEYDC